MKKPLFALGCFLAVLLAAGSAQAYAIYNHIDYKVCIQTAWNVTFNTCKFTIPPNSTHNGEHGAGLGHAYVLYHVKGTQCRGNMDPFDIPKGGYARIHDDVVKIYKHDNKEVDSKGISNCDCFTATSGKN